MILGDNLDGAESVVTEREPDAPPVGRRHVRDDMSLVERRNVNVLAYMSHRRHLVARKQSGGYEPQGIASIKRCHADPETRAERWLVPIGKVEFDPVMNQLLLHDRRDYRRF